MKKFIAGALFLLSTSLASTQAATDATFVAAGQADAQQAAALTEQGIAALPNGNWAGKLDKTADFALGGWQSLRSTEQAYGISKPFFSLQKGGQSLLNLGLFVGVSKPLVPLVSSSPRFLGGATLVVPGSALDWALGTQMGSYWLPKAKAGLLYAQDFTRLKAMTWGSGFVGVGLSYGFGAK